MIDAIQHFFSKSVQVDILKEGLGCRFTTQDTVQTRYPHNLSTCLLRARKVWKDGSRKSEKQWAKGQSGLSLGCP